MSNVVPIRPRLPNPPPANTVTVRAIHDDDDEPEPRPHGVVFPHRLSREDHIEIARFANEAYALWRAGVPILDAWDRANADASRLGEEDPPVPVLNKETAT